MREHGTFRGVIFSTRYKTVYILALQGVPFADLLLVSDLSWVDLNLRLVGNYHSYLLPKQDYATSQI